MRPEFFKDRNPMLKFVTYSWPDLFQAVIRLISAVEPKAIPDRRVLNSKYK